MICVQTVVLPLAVPPATPIRKLVRACRLGRSAAAAAAGASAGEPAAGASTCGGAVGGAIGGWGRVLSGVLRPPPLTLLRRRLARRLDAKTPLNKAGRTRDMCVGGVSSL